MTFLKEILTKIGVLSEEITGDFGDAELKSRLAKSKKREPLFKEVVIQPESDLEHRGYQIGRKIMGVTFEKGVKTTILPPEDK